jgi:serine/threonine protein kinase
MMRYIQLIESEYHINMVLEFVGGGSLLQRLRRCRTFPEMLAAFWTRQLLCTLMYLHSLGIVHRDIKAANIMITEDAVVKLGDFGIALGVEEASGGDADSMAEGSPYWMAPEVIEMQPPGTPSDIWSVACFVIELITGDPPYFELPSISALFRIVQDDMPPLPSASERCLDFLRACFARDPAQRPTAQVLLSHPFIEQVRDLDQCGAQCMLDELTSQQSLTGSDGSRRNSVCEEDMDALPPSPLTPRSRASTSMIPSSSLSTGRSVASLTRHYDAMPESSGTQSMVLVSGFETRRTKALSYTVFRLRVQRGTQKWSVFKTFSDFRDFFNRLKRELKTRRIKVKLPEFPPQKMFGAEKAGYLKKRRVQLNDFLDALNCLRPVTRTELLDDFLARDGEDAASHVSDDRTHTVVTSFHVDDASAADQ